MLRHILLLCLFLPSLGLGQNNMTLAGYLDLATVHSTELNDIWGYTDEFNNEYAF